LKFIEEFEFWSPFNGAQAPKMNSIKTDNKGRGLFKRSTILIIDFIVPDISLKKEKILI